MILESVKIGLLIKKEKKNNEITDYCNWKSDDIEISAINMFGIEN